MAGRSGRAGVSRGQEGGKAVKGVDKACGESFLIIPVSVLLYPRTSCHTANFSFGTFLYSQHE